MFAHENVDVHQPASKAATAVTYLGIIESNQKWTEG